jgi:small subunit ribosomal protein S20
LEVRAVANIKSAKKRILVSKKKEFRNKSIKSKVKTLIKKVEAAAQAGNKAEAEEALKAAISEISKAASKGVYHKNTTSRKISRMAQAVNKMA